MTLTDPPLFMEFPIFFFIYFESFPNRYYCFHEGGAPICGEDGLSSEYLVMKYFSTSTGPDLEQCLDSDDVFI